MTAHPRFLLCLCLASALATQGCYTSSSAKQVRVRELPKLNGNFSTTANSSSGPVIVYTATKVEAPDGSLVEVEGEFDLDVTLDNGKVYSFRHPIRADITGDTLRIASKERPPFTTSVARVEKAEIPHVDVLVTTLVIVGAVALLGGAVALGESKDK